MFKKIFFSFLLLLAFGQTAQAAGTSLSGYAWSPTIGWISFASSDESPITYGVILDNITSALSGYAWSPGIGWIYFNPNLTGPDGASDAYGARLDAGTATFSGWARACVVFRSGCSGALKSDSPDTHELGGWDGWIKFGGSSADDSFTYAASVDNGSNPTRFLSTDSSYVWGGEGVVRWISFCDPNYTPGDPDPSYCVKIGALATSCQVVGEIPNGQYDCTSPDDCSFVGDGDSLIWHGAETGGTTPLNLFWSAPADGSLSGTSLTYFESPSGPYSCPADNRDERATFSATDARGQHSTCSAATTVVCGSPPPSGGLGGALSSPTSPTIRISSQSLTSPAISSQTTFYSTELSTTTQAFIVSMQSLVDSDSSHNLKNPSFNNVVSCRLASSDINPSSSFTPCSSTSLTLTLLPNGGNTAYFNIRIATSTPGLNQYSPYQVVISASGTCTNLNNCGTAVRSFLFDYAVGTLNPI